jgi:hypothetical protein
MRKVAGVTEVFDAIQAAKAGATAFCTNFFPIQGKLQGWIAHDELQIELRDGAAFFLRQDRDFSHLYFCAADVPALERGITTLPALKTEPVTIDILGPEPSIAEALGVVESAGFRRHSRLLRLARSAQAEPPQAPADSKEVLFAEKTDCRAIVNLLECSFDRYADQLPTPYEIEAAVAARQVLVVKCQGTLGALLFFESQGFTSTIRYWVVDQQFRLHRFGSALMRHYLAVHSSVRRFILWVTALNEDAVLKYRHYGYLPDGLVDHVLVNEMIRP